MPARKPTGVTSLACRSRVSSNAQSPFRSRFWGRLFIGLVALLGLLLACEGVVLARKPIAGGIVPATVAADPANAKISGADPLGESRFPGGAALKTDPEQSRLLAQAEKSLRDGRADLAVLVWQKLLDEGVDTLYSDDGRVYASVARAVERMLARKGPEVLRTYRITADAEAASWMAKAVGAQEEEALATVERRYFLSSQGDDAAFRLACLALDRYDFVTAQRLLAKIRAEHPDPSIPAAELAVRQAVVESRMGDRKAAEQSLSIATTSARPRLDSKVAGWVEEDLKKLVSSESGNSVLSTDWLSALGSQKRRGTMPILPTAATSKTLSELWQFEFAPSITAPATSPGGVAMLPGVNAPLVRVKGAGMMFAMRGGIAIQQGMPQRPATVQPVSEVLSKSRREALLASWMQNKWHPTTQLLLYKGHVYFKSRDQLICFGTDANSQQAAWKSVWHNQFQPDSMSAHVAQLQMQMGMMAGARSGAPRTEEEVQLFGDRVHQSMSIHDGVIYSLEGQRLNQGDESAGTNANGLGRRNFNWGTTPRRSRTNFLAAYNAETGKAKWHRGASDDDKEKSTDVGFLSAPVSLGNRLLLPVTDGGNLWLVCLSADDGKTLWRRYLCDEPAGGCSAWSTVQIAVDGSEAYVAPGTGIVFACDTQSGAIRQAVRYTRDGRPNMAARYSGNGLQGQLDLLGWEDDVVVPYGRQLVVMASDCDKVFAIDRRSGEFLWESPRTSPSGFAADYCVGVSGRGLFVAGRNIVRRYDIPSGRLVWEVEIEDSLGRGALTADALYLPVKNSVLVLDLERGTEKSQVGVALTSNDPVGNLFSDGEKLWMAGAGRVYSMTSLDFRFEQLAAKIEAGDVQSMISRARLRLKAQQFRGVLEDLDTAYQTISKQEGVASADTQLLTLCQDLQLASLHPGPVLQMFSAWWPDDSRNLAAAAQRMREDQLAAALSRLSASDTASKESSDHYLVPAEGGQPARIILRASPLLGSPQLIRLATTAVKRSSAGLGKEALAAHISLLKDSAEKGSTIQKLLSAEAYAGLAGKSAENLLVSLSKQEEPRVKLAAARGLSSLKDQRGLSLLGDLLESDDAYVRGRSYQTLRGLTGQTLPLAIDGSVEQRGKEVAAWKKWIADNGKTLTWALPLVDGDVPLKRILFISQSQGFSREIDAAHQDRWTRKGRPTACQGLPNGHRLIADSQDGVVIELGDEKTPVWTSPRLPEQISSLQRLENGNTLATIHSGLVEFTPAGEVNHVPMEGIPTSAQRLASGMTLVTLLNQERVVEVDAAGNITWEVRGLSGPYQATRLDTGNTLIVQINSNQVIEVDRSGLRTVWKSAVPLVQPRAAARLQNGNTLISDQSGLHEVSADGKTVVWQMKQVEITSFHAF